MSRTILARLRGWEGLLLLFLLVVIGFNLWTNPRYLDPINQANLFQLGIEKAIVVLIMAFVIINGEIDLSVASMMGLAAALVAWLFELGVPMELAIPVALVAGALLGATNGFFVAIVGIPSLAVTLAGYIGYRGLARLLVEDRSVGDFPAWFDSLGQAGVVGPITFPVLLYVVLAVIAVVVLHFTGFGRNTIVIGYSTAVARFSGVRVARNKIILVTMSGLIAALAGVLIAARLGAVRASTADGFELDIITVVLLGGVSIFGGSGTMIGVLLATLLVLNLRNGLVIAGITGNTQTGVIGLLLILSVLVPNIVAGIGERRRRRGADPGAPSPPAQGSEGVPTRAAGG
ncbi:MAG: ABC transporter permease [Chloroflexota bacterium]